MRGGAITAAWLKANGVTHVFALSGEHVLPILDGCADEGIQVIGTRHEQGAVLAAEAFARVTGRPGVAIVTAGPGVTNAVTGLAVANTCGSPVLLLAGKTSLSRRYTGSFQDIDGRAVVAGVTKWAETCTETERIGYFLELAWRRMLAGRPGAVMLEIPHTVLKGEASVDVRPVVMPEPAGANPAAVARAVQMLVEAEKPMIIAGGGAFWSGAGDALRAFCERARIPITTLNAARGLVPDGDDISLGPLSEGGLVLSQADAVLLVGSKLDASVTQGGPPLWQGHEKLIQVDIEPVSVGLNRTPDLALLGDARVVLEQLAEAWDGKPKDEWLKQAMDFGAAMHQGWIDQTRPLTGSPVPPGRMAGEIAARGSAERILISDGGDIHTWCYTTFPAYRPGSFLGTHDALGTIGVGVPYALGAKAAAPEREVILAIGDGSFGFGMAEIETAARHGLPFVVVIANNGAWGNIRHEQGKQFGKQTDITKLEVHAYEKVAEAFGGHAERVEDSEEVGPAIDRALASGKVAVVNVITQPGVVSPVTEMVGAMMSML
ncbi:MAG TPA: thiamine pyrophosphate-binding protein [Actinomycetota bacterium]